MKVGPCPSSARFLACRTAAWTASTSWPSTVSAGRPNPLARVATDSPAMAWEI